MANRPIELQQNQNSAQSNGDVSSNNSDIPPETTLFEQIAVQIHRYKDNFIYLQRLPGILNLLELVIKKFHYIFLKFY